MQTITLHCTKCASRRNLFGVGPPGNRTAIAASTLGLARLYFVNRPGTSRDYNHSRHRARRWPCRRDRGDALNQAIASESTSRNLLVVAAGGLISGILTPLAPQLIDRIGGGPGDFRIALV